MGVVVAAGATTTWGDDIEEGEGLEPRVDPDQCNEARKEASYTGLPASKLWMAGAGEARGAKPG